MNCLVFCAQDFGRSPVGSVELLGNFSKGSSNMIGKMILDTVW